MSTIFVADKVLEYVARYIHAEHIDFDLEPYHNGNEHGYSIQRRDPTHSTRVSFSEAETGHEIVVYYGPSEGFDDQNAPRQEIADAARYFEPDKFSAAAGFIARYLNQIAA